MRVKFVFIYIIGNYSPNFSFFLPGLSTQSAMTSTAQNTDQQLPFSGRLTAIDAMRGIVMVLMALDHASHAFNGGRFARDSVAWWVPGTAIPTVQFLLRWVTHVCAPTFLFLAGLVLALSIARRQERGDPERTIDGFLLKRGLLILLLDPLWMSFGFGSGILFQVMYAIGASFGGMILLRRLGDRTLLAAGLAVVLLGEVFAFLALRVGGGKPGFWGALLITGGSIIDKAYVLYPLLPWLAYMILGWVCGRYLLLKKGLAPIGFFVKVGLIALLVFGIVRGLNGYGNMGLFRDNFSILQWLHVSKYPPGLSFAALELGLMFLLLALFFTWYKKRPGSPADPLLVFGRTPLFFYVIHAHLLTAAAYLLGMHQTRGLVETFIATISALMILYPLCRWYGQIKQTRSSSILRYL
jgi:uncharacterized membrane protein